jgi:hypothetical protein
VGLDDNGAQAMGVEKREIKIPIEVQKQAVDLDEESMYGGVVEPVKPLAFGQYGELGPGFEQILDQLAEEGADEAVFRQLVNLFHKNKVDHIRALATTATHTGFHKTTHRQSMSQTGSIQGAKTGSYNNMNDPTYPGPDGKMFTWKRNVALHLAQTRLPKSVYEYRPWK